MLKIPASTVPGLAADTRAALQATDNALLAHAQLFASLVEGASGVELPVSVTQEIYARAAAHGGKLVEGRNDLRHLITRLTAVKEMSDQRELAIGCPNGLPNPGKKTFFTEGKIDGAGQPV